MLSNLEEMVATTRSINTIKEQLDNDKLDYPCIESILFFPSISQYSTLLENNGFEVNLALLFDRPTELKGGLNELDIIS